MGTNNDAQKLKWLMPAIWIAMAICWSIQGYTSRHTLIAADGISYIEIAYGVLAGNWHALLNTYWSPGYPLVLAAFLKILRPSPAYELPLMRLVGWLTLVACLPAFEYFVCAFLRFRQSLASAGGAQDEPLLPPREFRVLAYALFFWCTTVLVPSSNEHPDILVFFFYLLASAVAMDLLTVRRGYARYILFGALLGAGFITKAIFFPLSFLFFVAMLPYKGQRNTKLLTAFLTFAIVCTPLIAGLSLRTHRFTVGDAGGVNRAQINNFYSFENFSPGTAVEASPHIQIFSGAEWHGSYPPWTEPSIRFTGHVPHIPLRMQLNRTHIVLRAYFDLFVAAIGGFTCGLLALIFLQRDFTGFVGRFVRQTTLWLPALAGFAAYATIRVEDRFLPGFTIGLFAAICGALATSRDPDFSKFSAQFARYVVLAATIFLVAAGLAEVGHTSSNNIGYPDWEAAAALAQFGIAPGDKVGLMGNGLEDHFWAHLAHVEIIGEILKNDVALYWAATPEQRQAALQQIAAAGAKALVTPKVPATAMPDGWKQLGDSHYYVLPLSPATALRP
jgi:hypothetical protein